MKICGWPFSSLKGPLTADGLFQGKLLCVIFAGIKTKRSGSAVANTPQSKREYPRSLKCANCWPLFGILNVNKHLQMGVF